MSYQDFQEEALGAHHLTKMHLFLEEDSIRIIPQTLQRETDYQIKIELLGNQEITKLPTVLEQGQILEMIFQSQQIQQRTLSLSQQAKLTTEEF